MPIITTEEKISTKSTPKNYENGNRNIYISIITLNVNGLNIPTKRHRLDEWTQKQDPIYAFYMRHTSDLETHTNWKWGARKRYST